MATLTRKTLSCVACEKNMLCFQGLQWHLMLIKLWYKWSTPGWVSTCSITRGSSRLHLLNANPANHVFISYKHLESWIKVIENSWNSASNMGRSNASNPVLFLRHPAEMFLIKFESTTSYEYPWVPKPNKQLQQPLLPLLPEAQIHWSDRLGPLLILSHFRLEKGTSFMIQPCDFEDSTGWKTNRSSFRRIGKYLIPGSKSVLPISQDFAHDSTRNRIWHVCENCLPNRWAFHTIIDIGRRFRWRFHCLESSHQKLSKNREGYDFQVISSP